MLSQFFANFTVMDVFVGMVIVWCCWAGFRSGILIEIFKIAALFSAIFIGLHFYLRLSNFLNTRLPFLTPVSQILAYSLLIGMCIGVFRIFRDGVVVFFRQDGMKAVSRGIGLMLGFGRGLLLSSMMLLGCLLIDQAMVTRMVRDALASQLLLTWSPSIYSGIFQSVVKPVFSSEPENIQVLSLVRHKSVQPDDGE